MNLLRSRKRSRRLLFYCVLALAFLATWSSLTVLILYLQDAFFDVPEPEKPRDDSYMGRGVQLVVGHYNGNLPAERLSNLSFEEINANHFSPLPGVGEGGKPVRLSPKEDLKSDDTFGINQFNLLISDRIALNRSLPDIRKQKCREKVYPPPSSLPTTSIIIVYHNEAFSTLARTLTSVVSRSPREVLHELILVDDFSNRTFLREELDSFVRTLPVKVKILRAQQRVGLIRARLMGAQEAEGDVLTFLDSHCECTAGWLEPLLARIKESRKTVVCPVIDVINDRTFAYQKGIELFRGGFNWNLQFRWYSMPPEMTRKREATDPIETPTMAGGLFSIERKYFEEIEGYDPGQDIWGGENLEISFRIWQCGGRVEILPCSHVGHIFRKASPHDFPGKSSGKILNGNLIRVAEVWMDEWKDVFYRTSPQALNMRSSVDVSQRLELRRRLRCKPFSWFLSNVWKDHFLPSPDAFLCRVGHSRSSFCLTSRPGEPGKKQHKLTMSKCSLGFDLWQLWLFTRNGELKSDEHLCLSASAVLNSQGEWQAQLRECGGYNNEKWDFNSHHGTLMHRESGLCLDEPLEAIKTSGSSIQAPSLRKCRRSGSSQRWELSPVKWRLDEDS